jgi:SdrD B-like domain
MTTEHNNETLTLSRKRPVGRALLLMALLLGAGSLSTTSAAAAGTVSGVVSGRVFRDYNSNGAFDTVGGNTAIDTGIGGVAVSAFDDVGTAVGTDTTLADGSYALNVANAASTALRVEFATPSGLQPSFVGTNNQSNVQFVRVGASAVDFALNNPFEYCQDNPLLCTPLAPVAPSLRNDQRGLETFSSSLAASYNNTSPATNVIALNNNFGATYGMAWDRFTDSIYLGAYAKRKSPFGPGGTGAIYKVDAASGAVSTFVDLNALFPGSTGADPHPLATTTWIDDTATTGLIGKIALGDIDLSPDGQLLYVMSLNNKTLYVLPTTTTPTATNVQAFPLDLGTVDDTECPDGDVRPFGLGVRGDGQVFVGGVCSAESSRPDGADWWTDHLAGLKARAYVWTVSSVGTYTTVLNQFLEHTSALFYLDNHAWTADPAIIDNDVSGYSFWTQLMLSDIAFAGSDLVLGFRDRLGDQVPEAGQLAFGPPHYWRGYGDIRRACATGSGYELDMQVSCGGAVEEWYNQDGASESITNDESAMGSIVSLPGHQGVFSTQYDPRRYTEQNVEQSAVYSENGVGYFSNTPQGGNLGAYAVLGNYTDDVALANGKHNGLGDLEAMCDKAPIQIGNRVWKDTNNNGVQEPSEPGLSGATLHLYDEANVLLGTALTDAEGRYSFASNLAEPADGGATPDAAGGGVTFGARLSVRADRAADFEPGGALDNLGLTVADATTPGTTSFDGVDSDARTTGGVAVVDVNPLRAGGNLTSLDFGFVQLPPRPAPSTTAAPASLPDRVDPLDTTRPAGPPVATRPTELPATGRPLQPTLALASACLAIGLALIRQARRRAVHQR